MGHATPDRLSLSNIAGKEHCICAPDPTEFVKCSFINYHRSIHVPIGCQKMASMFRSISNALDDFVLMAAGDPLLAMTVVHLGLCLLLAHCWCSWIMVLQRYFALPRLQDQADSPVDSPSSDGSFLDTDELYNAGFNPDVVNLPKDIPTVGASPSAAIQGSNVGLGLPGTWSEQSRVGSSPLRNSVSAASQSAAETVAGTAAASFSVRSSRDGSGGVVVSPPARSRSHVCFYPSSNPSQRGESRADLTKVVSCKLARL